MNSSTCLYFVISLIFLHISGFFSHVNLFLWFILRLRHVEMFSVENDARNDAFAKSFVKF